MNIWGSFGGGRNSFEEIISHSLEVIQTDILKKGFFVRSIKRSVGGVGGFMWYIIVELSQGYHLSLYT